jgi:hypothetical protein
MPCNIRRTAKKKRPTLLAGRRPPKTVISMTKYRITKVRKAQRSNAHNSARITLTPGGVIPKEQRLQFVRRSFVQFKISADGNGGYLPVAFHEPSLQWTLAQARSVIIWAGDVDAPAPIAEKSQALIRSAALPHVRPGGRVAFINVENAHWGEWFVYAHKHTAPGTEIQCVLDPMERT